MAGPREPSMEDILASIKRVIAEEKEIRSSSLVNATSEEPQAEDDDILELDDAVETATADLQEPADEAQADPEAEPQPPIDLGPPLMEEEVAQSTRASFDQLASLAAAPRPASANPMEDMVRDMLRPILKQWLDDHLPRIIDEHVKREIHRITGRPV